MMRPDDVHSIDDAVRIAVMAWRLSPTDEAESVLRQLATATSGLARVLGHHGGTVQAMAFSPDSSLFATIANDGSIQIWTGGTWTPRGALLVGAVHDAAVLRFSRNGAHLLALGKTRIEVWDLRRGRLDDVTSRALSAHLQAEKPVTGDISSDGRFVAIANRTDLAAWDAQAQQFVRAQSASAMTGALGVHFDAQDRLLVIDARSANTREGLGGSALSAVSWDLRANHLRVLGTPAPGSGHGLAYANDAVFTPSGDRFSTSGDGVELMWEVDPARGIHVVGGLPCCEPQPDETGRSVFVKSPVGRGNEWQRWDVASRTVVAQGHLSAYSKMLWSADGQWRAEMTHESGVQIWNGSDAGPASVRTIEPECERRQDMTTCVARVCEKLKPALNDEQLRELFGIASFEVMYDSYRKALGGPMC